MSEILRGGYDAIVTYGSSSSNHCRVVANAAARYGLRCVIISPKENYIETYNSKLIKQFSAEIVKAPLDRIAQTIDGVCTDLSKNGKPFFIPGGGHGNLGTQAYVQAYHEICEYEENAKVHFDYIFMASGTGTTQAGIVCGNALHGSSERQIVGISIARKNPRGGEVVEESVRSYLQEVSYSGAFPQVIFDDSYICEGYGSYNDAIAACIKEIMNEEGIPLNRTYTGKAFWGMQEYLKHHQISNANVLFIHTGGCPLFFDDMGDE